MDESNHGDFYGFAGLVADEHATKALTGRLNRIVDQAAVDYGIERTTELHAHPLFHGKGDWKDVGLRARIAIHESVVRAIVSEEVTVLMRWVNADRLRARQEREKYPVNFPPEQVCFQHILQRANSVAGAAGTSALIIADERSDRERHRDRFATYQTDGTPGVYMHTKLDNLLDTVHFAPSHRSRMLQAADMLAFTLRRVTTVVDPDPREKQVMDRIWRRLVESEKLHEAGGWP